MNLPTSPYLLFFSSFFNLHSYLSLSRPFFPVSFSLSRSQNVSSNQTCSLDTRNHHQSRQRMQRKRNISPQSPAQRSRALLFNPSSEKKTPPSQSPPPKFSPRSTLELTALPMFHNLPSATAQTKYSHASKSTAAVSPMDVAPTTLAPEEFAQTSKKVKVWKLKNGTRDGLSINKIYDLLSRLMPSMWSSFGS